jgi:hypothetical protein
MMRQPRRDTADMSATADDGQRNLSKTLAETSVETECPQTRLQRFGVGGEVEEPILAPQSHAASRQGAPKRGERSHEK